ncbi:MAG: hypothetical protein K0U36_01335 [Alphaproteobacteria bacterium]|nr:hypothetical protein [Alphaproteobacteria bacterium]
MFNWLKRQLGIYQPSFVICFTSKDWREIHELLRQHSAKNQESGGLLLGQKKKTAPNKESIFITGFYSYKALGARASAVSLSIPPNKMDKFYQQCQKLESSLVGDIHTHPAGVEQSDTDRQHPMNPKSDSKHVALILPNFARGNPSTSRTGVYRLMGKKNRTFLRHTIPKHIRKYHLNISSHHQSAGIIT